jgi:methionine biosynthesis protein MetW
MDRKKFIESAFLEKQDTMQFLNEPRTKHLLDLCKTIKGKKILDIGCGESIIGQTLKEKYNKDVYGIDLSKALLKVAMRRGIKCLRSDLEQGLPYKENSFDVVVAGEIIEHIYDTDHFLEEIKRVVVRGGELILSTPNIASLGSRLSLLIGKHPLMLETRLKGFSGHIRWFTYQALKELLEDHKFRIIEFCSSHLEIPILAWFTKKKILRSERLAKIFPKLGMHLIVKARCEK